MSAKPELIAIYRLEFYKKQKKWKLSSSRKEKKEPQKLSDKESNLNITYDVDNQPQEPSDPHNIAFMETDIDKNAQTNQTRLSLEKLEAVNIWPQSNISQKYEKSVDSSQKPKENWTQNRLLQLQMAASMEDSVDDNYGGTELKSWSEQALDWQNYEDLMPPDCVMNDVWNQDAIDSPSSDNFFPGRLDNVPWTTSPEEEWCSCDDCSVDSIGEFYRGADAAPHSSEFELTLPPCVSTSDVSFTCLSRLSSQQLASAASLHARVLRRLRRESAERERLRNSLSHSNLTFDDIPTRDVGSLHTDVLVDRIIAGSHRGRKESGEREDTRGRGRGRLVERDRYRFI